MAGNLIMNKFLARLEMSREVRRAFSIARDGIDGGHDEAEVAASIVERALDDKWPGYSACCREAYVKSAKYRVYLKMAYPSASDSSIDQAAIDIAWTDSRTVDQEMHEQNLKNARKSIEKMIAESKRGDNPLFWIRR